MVPYRSCGPRAFVFCIALLFIHIGNSWCPTTLVDLGPRPLYHYIAAWYCSCPIPCVSWGSFSYALPLFVDSKASLLLLYLATLVTRGLFVFVIVFGISF